ncbi:MAG: ABC transporter ATP-binding protein [Actinomycetota bacterium]|nr:ABC transporter ATP-binding protein [Actinomycetota bacterium]
MTEPRVVLEARDLKAGFGSTTVLHGTSLIVREGEVAAVLGLNGAGKSVTMKVLAGLVPVWKGTIMLDGEEIQNVEAEQRVGLGLVSMTQGRQVFPDLSVEQNLRLGAYLSRKRNRRRYGTNLESMYERFPRLAERRKQLAGTMSGGEQAILALARALMAEPKVLLIDEPTAGLAPVVVEGFLETLREINASGLTMLLVEQNVPFALRLAKHAHIMQRGRIVYESEVDSMDHQAMVRYLGIGRLLAPTVAAAGASTNGRAPAKGKARKAPPRKKS